MSPGGEEWEKSGTTTIGQAATEAFSKSSDEVGVIDLQREMHKGNTQGDSFEEQIREAVKNGAKLYEGDFFVTVLLKRERLLENVVRQYFIPRKSCPLPHFDQIVYHYHRKEERIEFLWVIPDPFSCHEIKKDALTLPKEYSGLISYVLGFEDGTLASKAQRLNGKISPSY